MEAAIIIPHYNDVVRLEKCLAALAPQVIGRPLEIVVVDNASTQDIAPVQNDFPWAKFHVENTPGAAAARNKGVAVTRAPRLFFLDADCVPGPDWVDTALGIDSRADLVGGRIDVFDETPPPRSGAEAFENVFAFHQKTYVEKKHISVTANLLTTRAVFDSVGPFDSIRSEDTDWCLRARDQGYSISYCDALVVGHPTRQDWPSLRKKWRRMTSQTFFMHGTTPKQRRQWAVMAVVVLASIPPHTPKVLLHPKLSPVEKWRGVVTLTRIRALRAYWMMLQALFGEKPTATETPPTNLDQGDAKPQSSV